MRRNKKLREVEATLLAAGHAPFSVEHTPLRGLGYVVGLDEEGGSVCVQAIGRAGGRAYREAREILHRQYHAALMGAGLWAYIDEAGTVRVPK